MAKPGDADELLALVCSSYGEWSLGSMSLDKTQSVIHDAVTSREPSRPYFGIIRNDIVEGAVGMFPTEPWNSTDLYLRVFYHYVHPQFRKSRHGKNLMQFAKWFGDQSGIPVIFELLHPDKTVLKEALYGREATRVGGLFLHGKMAPSLAAVA